MQHRNIDLYSCIASDSQQFFKRVFYLKQIIVIMGGAFERGHRCNSPRFSPLNLVLVSVGYTSLPHPDLLMFLNFFKSVIQ